MRIFLYAVAIAGIAALSACGESTESAYERGVEEGAAEVCDELRSNYENVHSELRSKRYC